MPEPNTPEIQEAAYLANEKYGNTPNLLSTEVGTKILTDQEKLTESDRDTLTQLLNRHAWETKATELLKLYNRLNGGSNLLNLNFIDIDNFKKVNDSYGHLAGDAILHEIAKQTKSIFRNTDILGRYGGDEFIQIGLSGRSTPEQIIEHFESIHQQISTLPIHLSPEKSIKVTQSWGLAIIDQAGIDNLMQDTGLNQNNHDYYPKLLQQIIKLADGKAYEAKESGRNNLKAIVITKQAFEVGATPPSPHHS